MVNTLCQALQSPLNSREISRKQATLSPVKKAELRGTGKEHPNNNANSLKYADHSRDATKSPALVPPHTARMLVLCLAIILYCCFVLL